MTDPRERFIEDDPGALDWSHEPVPPEERQRAREIFRWVSCH